MERFNDNLRIRISDPKHLLFNRKGTVVRRRISDQGAWVKMDHPIPEGMASFKEGDERRNNIILYPDQCTGW